MEPIEIVLRPGQLVKVTLHETDGEIIVNYGKTAFTVTADIPDTSGRGGEIYREEWDNEPMGDEDMPEPSPKAKKQKLSRTFCSKSNSCPYTDGHDGPCYKVDPG